MRYSGDRLMPVLLPLFQVCNFHCEANAFASPGIGGHGGQVAAEGGQGQQSKRPAEAQPPVLVFRRVVPIAPAAAGRAAEVRFVARDGVAGEAVGVFPRPDRVQPDVVGQRR